jgi:hypothetical protein
MTHDDAGSAPMRGSQPVAWASAMDCWAEGHASAKAHSEMELSIDRLVPGTTDQGRWDFASVEGRKEFARAVFQSGWDAATLRGLMERAKG